MRTRIQFLLVSAMALVSYNTYSQTLWELDKNQDSIKVYTRVEEGSAFKRFKAIALINAPIDQIIKILKNADRYTEWYGYTKTAKLLKKENSVMYNYVETIFPWPFRNRDMIYRMSILKTNVGTVEISLTGIPDYLPEKKGIVRMKKAKGYILLKSIANKTEVTYVFHSEPGNNIPPWLANSSIAELPFKTLTGLRGVLQKEINSVK